MEKPEAEPVLVTILYHVPAPTKRLKVIVYRAFCQSKFPSENRYASRAVLMYPFDDIERSFCCVHPSNICSF